MTLKLNEYGLSEQPAIEVFQDIGYGYKHGTEISPNGNEPERSSFSDIVLIERLKNNVKKINSAKIPDKCIDEAISQLLGFTSPKLIKSNKDFHKKIVNGISVEYEHDGDQVGDRVKIIDFDNPDNNDFFISNQFRIQIGDKNPRKPDLLVFINGLPIGVLEMKDPTNPKATIKSAYKQVTETYENDIPDLFHFNEFIGVLDKNNAKLGCLGSNWEWFSPWNYIEEEGDTRRDMAPAEILIRGAFDKKRVLDIIDNFIVFDEEKGKITKKLSAYHQYYAVNAAVRSTINTVPDPEDNRIGLVWHTQGSGKSLSMVFYTNKIKRNQVLKNPTIVVLTDRNDLDSQIHENFSNTGFKTEWADGIDDLRDKLNRMAGGIIFSTIQKFQTNDKESEYPEINDRQNIIVIADEAHRSQFKKLAQNVRIALPNASYIGFTATPIEMEDRSCKATFGKYISKYTIDQSERDGATVPIYYESRMARLRLKDENIDEYVNELLESESDDLKNEMTSRWTSLTKIIENSDKRIKKITEDIVQHFNDRDIEGKGLVVTISREAAYKYWKYLSQLDQAPETALVITDVEEFTDYPYSHKELKRRFKDDEDSLKLAVVCDKWITGFDAPHLHTMYLDKPMKNHNLLQAIGRVNRVYKDKPGGLVVDYIGVADNLKKALDKYTSDIQKKALKNIDVAVDTMMHQYEEVKSFFEDVEYENWKEKEGLGLQRLLHKAENEVLETQEMEEKFKDAVTKLNKSYALVSNHEKAIDIRSDVVFFRAIKDSIEKIDESGREEDIEKYDSALKELVSEEISVDDLVEITGFIGDGERKPVLSEDFLDDVEKIEYENLQLKMLQKIIENEINSRKKQNLAKYESFEEKLQETIQKYNNNFLTTKEVIKQLREYATELQEEKRRTVILDMTEEELAFYDAISQNTDKKIDKKDLREIAIELKNRLKTKADIDWTNRRKMRSKMKREVKKILRSSGFSYKEYEPLVEPLVKQAEAFYSKSKASA